ncbi:MAG: bifunctional folylpolyglutamate synthase/dihydrofolate synthase [Bacteroidales bacterium]|nr:bifunctional folylpolyglutamate synthase/dihydrofolate synthase [Bacteroidales bacterium]
MYQRTGKAAYKANLKNTLKLDELTKQPHKKFLTVHVGGTNGKGSVSHLLASVLMEAGYKTGLYTSPHLLDFRERIKINGIEISKNAVVDFVNSYYINFNQIKPSFFEMTVAMAFDYFAKEKVDIAIIEVGLGGRLDSTNIISPVCSVITNIGNDHSDLLGSSAELRAFEKAGIIKQNKAIIIGETQEEIKHVFENKANSENSPIIFADSNYSCEYSMLGLDNLQIFNIEGLGKKIQIKTSLLGKYQIKNVITAFQVVEILKETLEISENQLILGFEKVAVNTGLRGRWEIINQAPLTICDTGHNFEGISEIVNQINNTPYKKLHFVLGMVNDKKIDSILDLLPKNAHYYFAKASVPRALNSNELAEKARLQGLYGNAFSTVSQAYLSALSNAEENDLVFVGGSTFVVADLLLLLEQNI